LPASDRFSLKSHWTFAGFSPGPTGVAAMQTTIDLPPDVFLSAAALAAGTNRETHEWIAELVIGVIKSNEIHYLRKDVIDWREELLS
jgi:hypothetical protein